MQAYNDVADAWGTEAMIALNEPTLGLLGEDALLLLHLGQLEQAGVAQEQAQALIGTLRTQINTLDNLTNREELVLGYIPLWDMDAETGALSLKDEVATC